MFIVRTKREQNTRITGHTMLKIGKYCIEVYVILLSTQDYNLVGYSLFSPEQIAAAILTVDRSRQYCVREIRLRSNKVALTT